jgi:Protein of unknown function (DUF1161)
MKSRLTIALLSVASALAFAQGVKPCEDLKTEIAKKIEAKGVKSYTLDVVGSDKASDAAGKIVGSCDGGTKKIVYSKSADAAKNPPSGQSPTQTAAVPQSKR